MKRNILEINLFLFIYCFSILKRENENIVLEFTLQTMKRWALLDR